MSSEKKNDQSITQVVDLTDSESTRQRAAWGQSEPTAVVHLSAIKEIEAIEAMSGERQATLVALSGVNLGKTHLLEKETTTIGRGSNCDIQIDEDSVSRNHAEIILTSKNSYLLRDLGSTNGTFIGKDKVQQRALKEGDRIIIGLRTVYKVAFQDILEQAYQHSLYSSSVRDPLTRLYNRKYVDNKLRADLSYARRHNMPLSVLLLDADHFKRINDTYSHQTGDAVLKSITRIVLDLVRDEDTVGRFGGEEFIVIAPGTDQAGAQALAERIRLAIAQEPMTPVEESLEPFHMTTSIGVVTAQPGTDPSNEDLVATADQNLYQAKDHGRNRVVAANWQPDAAK